MVRQSPLRSIDAEDKQTRREGFALSPHDAPVDEHGAGSALQRALAVLETLLETDRSLGLVEIASRLDLPRQTAHRILNQLLRLGLLQRHIDRDRYLPGPRMRWLALETLYQSRSTAPWHAILEDLAEATEETCNIGVLDRNKVLLIDRIESKWALRVHSQVGRRLEPHSSAIGQLLLAYLDKKRRHELIGVLPLKRFTRYTIVDERELEELFAAVRHRGYSASSQGTTLGIYSIAVPIADPQGRVMAGLACQVPLVRMTPEQALDTILPRLREAAGRMESLLASHTQNPEASASQTGRRGRRGAHIRRPGGVGISRTILKPT